MSNHIWKAEKVSDREYHVIEIAHGLQSSTPYVLAKCTGPVPAGDIVVAMSVAQELKNGVNMVDTAVRKIKNSQEDLEKAIRYWSLPKEYNELNKEKQ